MAEHGAPAPAIPNGECAARLPGNKVTVVLGAQWGDEGKGKVVDLLAQDADIVCRCQVRRQPGRGGGRGCHLEAGGPAARLRAGTCSRPSSPPAPASAQGRAAVPGEAEGLPPRRAGCGAAKPSPAGQEPPERAPRPGPAALPLLLCPRPGAGGEEEEEEEGALLAAESRPPGGGMRPPGSRAPPLRPAAAAAAAALFVWGAPGRGRARRFPQHRRWERGEEPSPAAAWPKPHRLRACSPSPLGAGVGGVTLAPSRNQQLVTGCT